MANKVITEISKNKIISGKFIKYIKAKINHVKNIEDVKKFLNEYEFILQLGVIKSFLEDEYNICIHADNYNRLACYIDMTMKEAKKLFKENGNTYIITNFGREKDIAAESVFDNYGDIIIDIFKYIEDVIENPF